MSIIYYNFIFEKKKYFFYCSKRTVIGRAVLNNTVLKKAISGKLVLNRAALVLRLIYKKNMFCHIKNINKITDKATFTVA